MSETSRIPFGLVIAYLLPGFIGLAGTVPLLPAVATWLLPASPAQASLGPPIYVLLAAITIGMIISVFRWLLIDHIHHWTGLTPPVWDDSRLGDRLAAFNYLVESHYQYYQFVANTLVAVLWAYSINRWMKTSARLGVGTDVLVVILCLALFAASRDALSKYYNRTSRLIGSFAKKGPKGKNMYNGNHHDIEGGASTTPKPEVKTATQPKPADKPELKKTSAVSSPK
jgi:hypothetical protein